MLKLEIEECPMEPIIVCTSITREEAIRRSKSTTQLMIEYILELLHW